MTDLVPITALGGAIPQRLRFGALELAENDDLALASLSLRAGQPQPTPFGLDLPGPGGWRAGADGISAFWTGPGQWIVEGAGRARQDFATMVHEAAPGVLVTEQTDGFVVFEIASSAGATPVLALLERLMNIDIATLGPGCATRTGLEHMAVFVVRRAEDRLAVIGMRSAAGTLWHVLSGTMARLEDIRT